MKRILVLLTVLFLFTGCTAAQPNRNAAIDNSEEWDALFAEDNFRNVTIRRNGMAYGTEDLFMIDREASSFRYDYGDGVVYTYYVYKGDGYINTITEYNGGYGILFGTEEDLGTYEEYVVNSADVFSLKGMFDKVSYDSKENVYTLPYELAEMNFDAKVRVEDDHVTLIDLSNSEMTAIHIEFSDYGTTVIEPGFSTVIRSDEEWEEAVDLSDRIEFDALESYTVNGTWYYYSLSVRENGILVNTYDEYYSPMSEVYYGADNFVTDGRLWMKDYVKGTDYYGEDEAIVDVPVLVGTLLDTFSLRYRFPDAEYDPVSHVYTIRSERWGEDRNIYAVFVNGRLVKFRAENTDSSDFTETSYYYSNLDEIEPPAMG